MRGGHSPSGKITGVGNFESRDPGAKGRETQTKLQIKKRFMIEEDQLRACLNSETKWK